MGVRRSAARATATAGSAVVFAGLTVVIASPACGRGHPVPLVIGLAAAATVAVAVLIATTLLPAILGFAGRGSPESTACSATGRAACASAQRDGERGCALGDARPRRPLPVLLAGLALLVTVGAARRRT